MHKGHAMKCHMYVLHISWFKKTFFKIELGIKLWKKLDKLCFKLNKSFKEINKIHANIYLKEKKSARYLAPIFSLR